MSINEDFFSFSDDPSDAFTLAPSSSSVELSSPSSSSSQKSLNSPGTNIKDNPLSKRNSTSNFELKNLRQIPEFKNNAENLRKYQIDDSQLDKLKKMNNQMTRQQVFKNLLSPSNTNTNTSNSGPPNQRFSMDFMKKRSNHPPQVQSGIYLDNDPSDECKPIASLVKINPIVMKPPVIVKPIVPPPNRMDPKVMQKLYSIHLNKSRFFEFRRGRPLKTKPCRVKRYDIPKPNLKSEIPDIPLKQKSHEPKSIPNINENEGRNLPKNDSNHDLNRKSSISPKEEKKDNHNELDHKVQDILGLVQAEMNKINNTNFLNGDSFESSFFHKENDKDVSLIETKNVSPVNLENLPTKAMLEKEEDKEKGKDIENEDKKLDDPLFQSDLFFKDPRLDFFLHKLDSDDDTLSETEIEKGTNHDQLKLSDSEDDNTIDEETSKRLISSPITQFLAEKSLNRVSPAAHLNESVKSILRNLSEIKHQNSNESIKVINEVLNGKMDDSTEKMSTNVEFDVRNLLLVLAQETVKKQSLEIERLRKERKEQSRNEISRLVDLLAITFNNFKLINDKNLLFGKLKESLN
jgi:hypothetical protein